MSLKTDFRKLRKTLNRMSLHYADHPEMIEAIENLERFIATFLQVANKDVDVKINWERLSQLFRYVCQSGVAIGGGATDLDEEFCNHITKMLNTHRHRIEADMKVMDEFDPREIKIVETAGKNVDAIFEECKAIESFGIAAKLDMQTKLITCCGKGGWTKELIADALKLDRDLAMEFRR